MKAVIVTGAARGPGRAIARRLPAGGRGVALADLDRARREAARRLAGDLDVAWLCSGNTGCVTGPTSSADGGASP